ncbi:MAG: TetR/AcrR family transcriptional regulator [Marinifilaceae bacterium]
MEKACNLYCQYGIRSVTMDDVSRELGISKKTLYNFFTNKKDLIDQSLQWRMDNPMFSFNAEKLKGLNAIDKYLAFDLFVSDIIKQTHKSLDFDLEKYYPDLWNKFNGIRLKVFRKEIHSNLDQGITEGLFRDNFNKDFISRMLVQFYINFWREEFQHFTLQEMRSVELHRELTLYHLHGICSPKGIDYLNQKLKQSSTQEEYQTNPQ